MCCSSYSQSDTITITDTNSYRIIKSDGGELFGKILHEDSREILILTKNNKQIYIPQHVIEKIELVKNSDFNEKGAFVGEDKFATRYFITTNGLPIKKGEHYVQWNLFGPDFQFGIGKDLGVGVMTSWIGVPIIGTIKKSWKLGEKSQFAIGGLVGTGSWADFSIGGALPFGTLSFGDRSKNIAVSGGYGAVWGIGNNISGRAITSIAGMIKISKNLSLVFDSFILFPSKKYDEIESVYNEITEEVEEQVSSIRDPGLTLLMPGIRWHQGEGKAIQFGFAGFGNGSGDFFPIPMVQWYRTL
jgi:hypothetical protein